jgi:peptidoglycan/LPS O-acetylase OafA/YrhL
MEARLSRKIRNISFLLLIMVAFIHGYNENLRFADGGAFVPASWLSFIQRFISDGVCRIAVPLFFAISGYLACESTGPALNTGTYAVLLKKRFFSLLVPYLLVSAAGIALVFLLQLIPYSRPFFNNYSAGETPISEWVRIWLLSPVPFQLWFLRFLMNYFLFFPVLFLAIRYLRELFVLVLFLFWSWTTLYYKIGAWKIAFYI